MTNTLGLTKADMDRTYWDKPERILWKDDKCECMGCSNAREWESRFCTFHLNNMSEQALRFACKNEGELKSYRWVKPRYF